MGDLWYPTLLSSARVYMQISLYPTNEPFGLKKLKLHSELYILYTIPILMWLRLLRLELMWLRR